MVERADSLEKALGVVVRRVEARTNAATAMAVVRDARAALATARDAVEAERRTAVSRQSRRNGVPTSKADARAAALRRYRGNAAKRSPLPPTPTGKENASMSPVRYPSEPRSPLAGNSAAWK